VTCWPSLYDDDGDGDGDVLRFADKLHLSSVMNENKQKHIRVQIAMTTEQQQQRSQDRLHEKLV